ncbi:C39 family peptidase [Halobacillus sp. MO56]
MNDSFFLKVSMLFTIALGLLFSYDFISLAEASSLKGVANQETTYVFSTKSTRSEALKSYDKGSILTFRDQDENDNWYRAVVYVDGESKEGYIHTEHVHPITTDPKQLTGIAIKAKTAVFELPSRRAGIWKSYHSGSILYYESFTSNWYKARVYVNGKAKTGYIAAEDVEQPVEDPVTLYGVAMKNQTHVYEQANSTSDSLKWYIHGSLLKYETYISGWYKATVFVNGKSKTGYISVKDVEQPVNDPVIKYGVALQPRTPIYKRANKGSKSWKTYSSGSILKYETYVSGWYKARVYVDGKLKTGFISANDVTEPTNKPVTHLGISLKHHTNVYKKASKASNPLKSYPSGSKLKYETYVPGWYKATVFVNGKAHTGYISAADVEVPVKEQSKEKGISFNGSALVHAKPSKYSKKLKGYREGSVLQYKTYMKDWYQATVYINGERRTGYIHKSDVIDINSTQKDYRGVATRNRVYVYSSTSTQSKKVKGYDEGSILKFKSYTRNWHEATVYVNGATKKGYIHNSDLDLVSADDKIIRGTPVLDQFPAYPTGCESVSVAMLLKGEGYDVSVRDVVNVLPKGPRPYWFQGRFRGANPEEEFVGHPSNSNSFGAFEKPMLKVVDHYTNGKGVKLTGKSFNEQLAVVKSGTPIVMWATINLLPSYQSLSWYDKNYNKVTWQANEHAFVVVGVSENNLIVHDPYIGERVVYDKELVKERWNEMGRRAITIN